MTAELDDIFQQILHSEVQAQERKSLLSQLKSDIQNIQGKLEKIQEEHGALQGQLIIKVQKASEESLNVHWMSTRESILKDKKASLEKRKLDLQKENEELDDAVWGQRAEFSERMMEFTKGYDLIGRGRVDRKVEAKDELRRLTHMEKLLEEELSKFRIHQDGIAALEKEKIDLKKKLDQQKETCLGYDELVTKGQEKLTTVDMEKKRVANIPYKDPEFVRLHGEMESACDDALEEMCSALQQELQKLQQLHWQRQLHKQKQQQRWH